MYIRIHRLIFYDSSQDTFYRQQVHAHMHKPVQLTTNDATNISPCSHQHALHVQQTRLCTIGYSVYNITLAIRFSVMLSTNFI